MEDSSVYESTGTCATEHPFRFLARNPLLAIIVFILCSIVVLPSIVFMFLSIVALILKYIGILRVPGEIMLFKILIAGFLISVGIIFFVTSGTIFALYHGISRMYHIHFNLKNIKNEI